MYCTNCGRKLPEDGSPCICRQQPAQPEQNTNTAQPPVYTPPVNAAPNYAQPPVQYPVQPPYYAQPVMQATPVHGMLKRFFTSPLFLTAAILMSANVLFQIIAALVPVDVSRLINQIYSVLPYEMQFAVRPGELYGVMLGAQTGSKVLSVLGILIGGGLTAAAFWITFISAKDPRVPAAKTSGLTIMKVFTILGLIAMSLAALLCVFGGLVLIFLIADASDYGGMGDMEAALIGVCIGILIAALAVCVFKIIYSAKVLKMLNNAKNAMATGRLFGKASVFVAVINFITAFIVFFGVFGDVSLYGWTRLPLGLSAAALNFVYGLLVLKFNKEAKMFGF